MTKKRLQKIYNCVMMHFNLFSVGYANNYENENPEVLRMLKNERKTLYRDFEKWYNSRRIDLSENKILNNQEIYETYLQGTHCLYFHGILPASCLE